jgi:hypothetical protein
VTTPQTNATGKKDLMMSDVFCVEETILRIIRNVRSTKNCSKKIPTAQNEICTPLTKIKHHPLTQSRETYAQIIKRNHYAPSNIEQTLNAQQSHKKSGDVQDLKNMISLFEQIGIMLNFLTIAHTKLKQRQSFYNFPYGTLGLAKHTELRTFIFIQNIDVILISETHFAEKNYLKLPNYTVYHTTHPTGTAPGGQE